MSVPEKGAATGFGGSGSREKLRLHEAFIVALARLIPVKVPNSVSDPAGYTSQVEKRAAALYDGFYSKHATFEGARVVEIGGTTAAATYYLKKNPAKYHVVNLQISSEQRAALQEWVERGVVEFVVSTARSVPIADGSVDILISENTFEHLTHYSDMIAEFSRILRPGGMVLSKFSPLYYSPFGAHLYETIKMPWLTLILEDSSVERALRHELARMGIEKEQFEYQWDQYHTLNKLRPHEFLAPFQKAPWSSVRYSSFPFGWSISSPEPVRSLLTHGLTVAATRGPEGVPALG